jgi:hypothetical protein
MILPRRLTVLVVAALSASALRSQEPAKVVGRSIPLAEVRTTAPQENLKRIEVGEVSFDKNKRKNYKEPHGEALDRILERARSTPNGGSFVIVTEAYDLAGAVYVAGARSAEAAHNPAKRPASGPREYWLIADLGVGSAKTASCIVTAI